MKGLVPNESCVSVESLQGVTIHQKPFPMLFKSVVIWGYPLHSHTHSYIHNAFFRAFRAMSCPSVQWFPDVELSEEHIASIPEGSLFITEGNTDKHIPILPSCYYLLHNCNTEKYTPCKILVLQVMTNERRNDGIPLDGEWVRFDKTILYMPWATDLMPDEIQVNIDNLETIQKHQALSRTICFIGSYNEDPWGEVTQFCRRTGMKFDVSGGFGVLKSSVEGNVMKVQQARLSPAFQIPWQIEHGYIPCRIFKNISYGALGITNSDTVQDLFKDYADCLVYNPSAEQALDDAINFALPIEKQKAVMKFVKDHHTYVNRIESIEKAFQLRFAELA